MTQNKNPIQKKFATLAARAGLYAHFFCSLLLPEKK
jgi:hypothetical protein